MRPPLTSNDRHQKPDLSHFENGQSRCLLQFHFCPRCGATVYYELEGNPEHIAVPVGAFAEPGFPAPSFSVYEDRMHSWVQLPAGIEHLA
ncbi:MAG TPA: GFA family protein [Burkholderiaceae bacterium]|nr:GFA family protein [Burkholderiaceae bacterium]